MEVSALGISEWSLVAAGIIVAAVYGFLKIFERLFGK